MRTRSSLDVLVPTLAGPTPALSVVMLLGSRYEDLAGICDSLRRILTPSVGDYEVLIVDEATGSHTQARVRALAEQFSEIRVLRLHRHVGESAALAIAAQAARADLLLTLDPYLHVALEYVPTLLAPLANGADLVCAWRWPRSESRVNRMASAAFNGLAGWLTKTRVHDLNCRMRAMRREVLCELPIYGDLHRFLPIFAAQRGYRCCEVQVPQQPGKHEIGARSPASYVRRLLDLLTLAFLARFMKRPLHLFGLVGLASLLSGLAIGSYLIYTKVALGMAVGHRPLLLLAVLLVVIGVQIASLGLLGELMIFTHARQLSDYVVEEERGG